MNKKRVDRDMATLVMIFQNLIKLPSQGSLINEGAPTPFCPSSLVKAFIESFPCQGAAQLCFKDAILLAESFDINQLLCHEASDLTTEAYVKYASTKKASASTLFNGRMTKSKNLRIAFGYTMIATSFVLLQWKDDVLSVISDVEFGRLPKKWPTAAESSCCCLDPHFLLPHLYLRLRSIAILRKNEVEGCMKV